MAYTTATALPHIAADLPHRSGRSPLPHRSGRSPRAGVAETTRAPLSYREWPTSEPLRRLVDIPNLNGHHTVAELADCDRFQHSVDSPDAEGLGKPGDTGARNFI